MQDQIEKAFYDFKSYVDRERILTYWNQIAAVMALTPSNVLEVGVGPKLVSSYLAAIGLEVTTVDVNAALAPDVVGDVRDLQSAFGDQQFDVVLCARVLHHLPLASVPAAISSVNAVARAGFVLTLPRDVAALQLGARRTGGRRHTATMYAPTVMKRAMEKRLQARGDWEAYGQWRLDQRHSNEAARVLDAALRETGRTVEVSTMEDAPSHAMVVVQS